VKRLLVAVLLLVVVGCHSTTSSSTAETPTETSTVVNAIDGQPTAKLDTDGNPIDAHEGSIVFDGGLYWMIGNASMPG
jgi:hypothetical protein